MPAVEGCYATLNAFDPFCASGFDGLSTDDEWDGSSMDQVSSGCMLISGFVVVLRMVLLRRILLMLIQLCVSISAFADDNCFFEF